MLVHVNVNLRFLKLQCDDNGNPPLCVHFVDAFSGALLKTFECTQRPWLMVWPDSTSFHGAYVMSYDQGLREDGRKIRFFQLDFVDGTRPQRRLEFEMVTGWRDYR